MTNTCSRLIEGIRMDNTYSTTRMSTCINLLASGRYLLLTYVTLTRTAAHSIVPDFILAIIIAHSNSGSFHYKNNKIRN